MRGNGRGKLKTYNMKEYLFTGTSANGDFMEAINHATFNAKESLCTDHIIWELEKINGKNGGFIQENIIEVLIKVRIEFK